MITVKHIYKYEASEWTILFSTLSKIFNLRIPKGVNIWYIITLSEAMYLSYSS